MQGFETIVLYLGMSVVGVLGMLWLANFLGKYRPAPNKSSTYECGVPLLDPSHKRYDVKYYLVAVLFLVFDLETVLLYPVVIKFHEFAKVSWAAFIEIFIFVAILLLGLYYAIAKKAVDWE